MRKTFLKLIAVLSVFVIGAGSLIGTITSAPVKAESNADERVQQSINVIETTLFEQDTDVMSELENQLARYQTLYENAETDGERDQIFALIVSTEGMILDYTCYANGTPSVRRGIEHAVYSPAISAIVAYFNANNYNLSAELLSYARINNELNSFYHPVNGREVLSSPVFQEICKNDQLSGSARFPKEGRVNDMDLFYSLHQFDYAKFDDGRLVVIKDRYDFAYNAGFAGLDNISVNLAYEAQEAGVLVPFYNIIDMKVEVEVEPDSLIGIYDQITRDENGEFHVFDSACDGECNVWNCEFARTPMEYTDLDEDGKCDYCGEKEASLLPPSGEIAPPNSGDDLVEEPTPKQDLGKIISNAIQTAKNYAKNLLSGCSSILTAPIGGLTAVAMGVVMLLKKKK